MKTVRLVAADGQGTPLDAITIEVDDDVRLLAIKIVHGSDFYAADYALKLAPPPGRKQES